MYWKLNSVNWKRQQTHYHGSLLDCESSSRHTLGPALFLVLINDATLGTVIHARKYVDHMDTLEAQQLWPTLTGPEQMDNGNFNAAMLLSERKCVVMQQHFSRTCHHLSLFTTPACQWWCKWKGSASLCSKTSPVNLSGLAANARRKCPF